MANVKVVLKITQPQKTLQIIANRSMQICKRRRIEEASYGFKQHCFSQQYLQQRFYEAVCLEILGGIFQKLVHFNCHFAFHGKRLKRVLVQQQNCFYYFMTGLNKFLLEKRIRRRSKKGRSFPTQGRRVCHHCHFVIGQIRLISAIKITWFA